MPKHDDLKGVMGLPLGSPIPTPTPEEALALEFLHVMVPPASIGGPWGSFFIDYLQERKLWSFEEIVFWLGFLIDVKPDHPLITRYKTWQGRLGRWRAELKRSQLTPHLMTELRRAMAGNRLKAKEVDGELFVDWEEAIRWWFRYSVPEELWKREGRRPYAATAAKKAKSEAQHREYARRVHAKRASNKSLSRAAAAKLVHGDLVRQGKKPHGVRTIADAAKEYPSDRKNTAKPK